jgi:hypothetical protein
MFKISPIQDKALQKKYAEMTNSEYRENFFAYAMTDYETGELMAISQFEIAVGDAYISDIKSVPTLSDFEAMFILARQTMNFIDLCGNHTCYASKDASNERLLRAIGFKEIDGQMYCDMTGMFDGNCGGHKVEL